MTLLDLANKIGVTIKTIQRYELGERKLDVAKLKLITDALGISYDQFLVEIQAERFPDKLINSTPTKMGLSESEKKLLAYFNALNEFGQKKAMNNISDLARITAYTNNYEDNNSK